MTSSSGSNRLVATLWQPAGCVKRPARRASCPPAMPRAPRNRPARLRVRPGRFVGLTVWPVGLAGRAGLVAPDDDRQVPGGWPKPRHAAWRFGAFADGESRRRVLLPRFICPLMLPWGSAVRCRLVGIAVGAGLLALGAANALIPAAAQAQGQARPVVSIAPTAMHLSSKHWQTPPTTADCVATAGIPCYAPFQLQRAYDLKRLYKQGLTGRGRTIVIVDAFGSPTVK